MYMYIHVHMHVPSFIIEEVLILVMYSPEHRAQLVMNYRRFDYVAVVSNNNMKHHGAKRSAECHMGTNL